MHIFHRKGEKYKTELKRKNIFIPTTVVFIKLGNILP